MAERLNINQKQAVDQRDCSILVSAPAGSGKTKILVSRIMSLIINDRYDITELLVLTFTKAASLEMKQRLSVELDRHLSDCHQEDLRLHLLKQKEFIHDAYITNFHSFCSDLLSQYGYLIHINSFQILANSEVIKRQILDQCITEWSSSKDFLDFMNRYYSSYSFQDLKDTMISLDSKIHSMVGFDQYFDQIKESIYQPLINTGCYKDTPLKDLILSLLQNQFQQVKESFAIMIDFASQNQLNFFFEEKKGSASFHDAYQKYYHQIELAFDDLSIFDQCPELGPHRNAAWKDVPENVKKQYKKLIDRMNSFTKYYHSLFSLTSSQLLEVMTYSLKDLEYIYHLTQDFQNHYDDYKTKENILDFNDLEKYTLKLLDKEYGISDILYHQLKEIMIDEYQDTNDVQETLINKIVYFQKPVLHRFMVGDMKQSIYRFRKADINIFKDKFDHYQTNLNEVDKEGDCRIDLGFNYRSDKVVLDSINYIFNQIMDTHIGGLEYYHDDSAKLNWDYDAKGKPIDHPQFHSELLLVLNPKDSGDRDYSSDEYEAMMIAKRIQDMVGHDDIDIYHQPLRKVKYQDIAVLMRSVDGFITYKKVFDRYSIPNSIILTKGYLESPEIISCLSILRALDNHLDDIAFTSLLIGHYTHSHFSHDLIYEIKQVGLSMYDSVISYLETNIHEELSAFMVYYQSLREMLFNRSVYEVLQKFIIDNEYDSFVSSLRNGEQRYNNILLFIEKLKEDQHLSLHAIIQSLKATLDNDINESPASVPSSHDAVRFMTIHKSKGLEFPIVFVNRLQKQFNFKDKQSMIVDNTKYGLAINPRIQKDLEQYKDVTLLYKNPYLALIGKILDQETIDEELRILYVALTRASKKLILTATIKDISTIEGWQNDVIQHTLISQDPLLCQSLRQSQNYLDWIGKSIVSHPDFLEACQSLAIFDDKIKKSINLEAIQNNALTIKIQERTQKLIDSHSLDSHFYTHVFTLDTIEESIITNYAQPLFDQDAYHRYHDYPLIQSSLDKTIAVTKKVDDGNRQYDLHYQDDHQGIKANDRGTIIHRVLENLPLKDNINLSDELESLRFLFDEPAYQFVVDYQPHIQNFLNSEIYQLMLKSKVYKEKPFSLKDENGQIIHGIFDVVCIDDQKITIIDYKTDSLAKDTPKEALVTLHQGQMEYYKKILSLVFPEAHIQAIVYYLAIHQYVIL